MKLFNRLSSILRNLFRRDIVEKDLGSEVDSLFDLLVEEKRAANMSREDALREAQIEMGGREQLKEEVRTARAGAFLETIGQDIRYGLRVLLRRPGFSIIAVLTLGLGIGANSAIFSVVNSVLVRPLPYESPERIAWIWGASLDKGTGTGSISPPDFVDYRDRNRVFRDMAAFTYWPFTLTGRDGSERIESTLVSAGFFKTLGVGPRVGRGFLCEEEQQSRQHVAVLGHGLWSSRFGSDPELLGRTIELNGGPYTVVGIMPPGFEFPKNVEIWAPIPFDSSDFSVRHWHFLQPLARLKEGETLESAEAQMNTIARSLESQYPDSNKDYGTRLVSLPDQLLGDIRPTLLLLLAAVTLVLLIACANVANLLLTRGESRRKELALRRSLGASRLRLARQLLTESLLLSTLGGLLGLLLAQWGIGLLLALGPPGIPRLGEIEVDGRVLAYTITAAILTAILFGLFATYHASRSNLSLSLRAGARLTGGISTQSRMRDVLVIGQVAVAMVLLVMAGLMVHSLHRLTQVDPGFTTDSVLTAQLALNIEKYGEDQRTAQIYRRLLEKLRSLPGVESAATIFPLPMGNFSNDTAFAVEGDPAVPEGEKLHAFIRNISPDYFYTLGIPLQRGRIFNERDSAASRRVVIINDRFAQEIFPGENPVGRRITLGSHESWTGEIVGVVGGTRHRGLADEPWREIYTPFEQTPRAFTYLAVRSRTDVTALAAAIKKESSAVESELAVSDVRTMAGLVSDSAARPRFRSYLLSLFGLLSLFLAAMGVYGVLSYSVASRTHEFGIRMAVGAGRREVLRLVIVKAAVMVLVGLAIGLALSLALVRLISGMLFEITTTDPATFLTISILLLAAGMTAGLVPSLQAIRVDPMTALRDE